MLVSVQQQCWSQNSEFCGCANSCNKFVSSRSWWTTKISMILLLKGTSGPVPPVLKVQRGNPPLSGVPGHPHDSQKPPHTTFLLKKNPNKNFDFLHKLLKRIRKQIVFWSVHRVIVYALVLHWTGCGYPYMRGGNGGSRPGVWGQSYRGVPKSLHGQDSL